MTEQKRTSASKAVFLDWASLSHNDIDNSALSSACPQWQYRDNTSLKELPGVIEQVEIIVSNKVQVNLDKLPARSIKKLRLICVAATGYDNINIAAASKRNVKVCNVRNYATASVTQHVFAMLFCLSNHLLSYRKDILNGEWSKSSFFSLFHHPISEISGKTMGIIGYGVLGKSVANMAKSFGMKVLVAQHPGLTDASSIVPLRDLLRQSDVISIHCPLNEGTRGLIGENEFKIMKPNAILINAARGGIVDEIALVNALRHKAIAAAGFDVLTQEPPPFDHPLLKAKMDNLLITPHVAWASQNARQSLVNKVAQNISAFFADQPINLLN